MHYNMEASLSISNVCTNNANALNNANDSSDSFDISIGLANTQLLCYHMTYTR